MFTFRKFRLSRQHTRHYSPLLLADLRRDRHTNMRMRDLTFLHQNTTPIGVHSGRDMTRQGPCCSYNNGLPHSKGRLWLSGRIDRTTENLCWVCQDAASTASRWSSTSASSLAK